MEVTTINEILFEAISKASKITIKNPQVPILEYILLETVDQSTIRVTAHNLDITYKQDVFVKSVGEDFKKISVCISGPLILSYLSLFSKNDQVSVKISDKNLVFTINKQKSTINGASSVEYPKNIIENSITDDEVVLKIPSDIYIKGIQSVAFSAAITSIKPELSCILMAIDQQVITFAATDGFRLAERRFNIDKGTESYPNQESSNTDDFKQVLIPSKTLQDALKVIPGEVEVGVVIKKGLLYIKLAESFISLRTVNGMYPNYTAIIPKEFSTHIEISSEDFLNGLKASNLFSDEFNYVRLDIDGSNLLLNSKNSKIGESVYTKEVQKTGENISQSYNHRYLSDFVSKIKDEVISIDISGKTTPTILKVKNDSTYTYLVMPMNK